MQIYMVGGAVRDEMLGLPVQDRDWVVVGATPAELLALGYQQVGKDFPVFLHPKTHEEYALARTERKTGNGYKGFAVHFEPDVSLEDDLLRRDLSINAMARDLRGDLMDPYGGRQDLEAKLLRHVSPAFAEDPVRILRVARFAARFASFSVAPETMALMRHMVDQGEVDHLVPERVWQEFARGLMAAQPRRMIEVLRECGALARILPEVDALFGVPQPPQHHPEVDTGEHVLQVLQVAAAEDQPLIVRWAALLHDVGKGLTPRDEWPRHIAHEARGLPLVDTACERLRVPVDCRDLARMLAREHTNLHRALELRPSTLVQLFERCDALRRPERFHALVAGAVCDHRGRGEEEPDYARPYPQAARLALAEAAFRSVDAGAVARACADKSRIWESVHRARLTAVKAALGADTEA